MTIRAIVQLMALAGLILLLAACGGNETTDITKLCTDLAQLNETASAVGRLDNNANIAQMVQLGAGIENDWNNVSTTVEKLGDPAIQAAFAPYDQIFTGIPSVTQETSPAVARQTLDAMSAVAADVYSQLYPPNCQ